MKSIILASQSPQRKKLLRLTGLPFTIQHSQAEEISTLTRGVAHLVQTNARLKARDVAARMKKGVVVGADTVGYLGKGQLILKPKSMAEAKVNLKRLMKKPHWIYTGVAVIDVASQKMIVGFEKTKVFMRPLSDKEIDRYYRHMSPLDKAGGFDIEGKGSLFIHRIEGCYFNVVGLPLARLNRMLKEVGVYTL